MKSQGSVIATLCLACWACQGCSQPQPGSPPEITAWNELRGNWQQKEGSDQWLSPHPDEPKNRWRWAAAFREDGYAGERPVPDKATGTLTLSSGWEYRDYSLWLYPSKTPPAIDLVLECVSIDKDRENPRTQLYGIYQLDSKTGTLTLYWSPHRRPKDFTPGQGELLVLEREYRLSPQQPRATVKVGANVYCGVQVPRVGSWGPGLSRSYVGLRVHVDGRTVEQVIEQARAGERGSQSPDDRIFASYLFKPINKGVYKITVTAHAKEVYADKDRELDYQTATYEVTVE